MIVTALKYSDMVVQQRMFEYLGYGGHDGCVKEMKEKIQESNASCEFSHRMAKEVGGHLTQAMQNMYANQVFS